MHQVGDRRSGVAAMAGASETAVAALLQWPAGQRFCLSSQRFRRSAMSVSKEVFARAQAEMEAKFSQAIARYSLMDPAVGYSGYSDDFRWAKDGEIYHWYEFAAFYASNAQAAWSSAIPLTSSDGSLVRPTSLLQHVEPHALKHAI